VWRQALPEAAESTVPTTLSFKGSRGSTVQLRDVLIGDVFLCSGVRAFLHQSSILHSVPALHAALHALPGRHAVY
jgi:hypothetical protein